MVRQVYCYRYEQLREAIEKLGSFQSLVQMPDKPRDPDWPNWVARATKDEKSYIGKGDTDTDALEDLLNNLTTDNSTVRV